MILDLVREYGAWSWFVVGLALVALELLVPGSFLVWLGLAAIVAGGVGVLIPVVGWQVQFLVFAATATLLVLVGRQVFSRAVSPGERPFLNERGARLVGTTYVLDEPIVNGRGRILVADSRWKVVGPDLPSGTRVRVASVDGAQVTVEPVE